MNRTSVPRRLLAVAASAFIGAVGAVALASPASAHHTYVNGAPECPDPETGEWVVEWTIDSWDPTRHPGFNVETYELVSFSTQPAGLELAEFPLNVSRGVDESFVVQQIVPGDVDRVKLSVEARWDNQATSTDKSGWVQRPAPCEDEGEQEVEVPIAWASDCDSLFVKVDNPLEEGDLEVSITSGDVTENLTIAPGESEEVSFDAEEGTVATVTIGDESTEVVWEEPEDCEEPEEGEGGGDEELPLTGGSTPLIVGGALALLAAGAGLFLVARRRRLTFTA